MGHDRTDQIMVVGVHKFDVRTDPFPQGCQLIDLGLIRGLGRHNQAPAVVEQRCKA